MGKKPNDIKVARQAAGNSLTEVARIRVGKTLEDFRASDAQVYTFEPGMSKEERATLHVMCRKMGMQSKSSGFGAGRRLSVYKSERKLGSNEKNEGSSCLELSKEAKYVLQDLFMHYPPEEGELSEGKLRPSSEKASDANMKRDPFFSIDKIKKCDIEKKLESYATRMEAAHLKKVLKERAKLPIASFRDAISSAVETNQVVLVSGETGCGKTTQVPQYILDYMWAKGAACKIVCTQPRRISAISVAERISYERGESIGDTVGYKIRMEAKGGKHSSIVFCTNGVLLRLLVGRGKEVSKLNTVNKPLKDGLRKITHIIVDEIHERDRFSDFMLAILRDILPLCPQIRLVLMSATIDANRFSQYFGGCAIIQVPGFTHSVKTLFLEDVLSILNSGDENHLSSDAFLDEFDLTEECKAALDEAISLALYSDELDPLLEIISCNPVPKIYNYQHSVSGESPLMVLAGKGRVEDICTLLSFGADCSLTDKDTRTTGQGCQPEVCEPIESHVGKYGGNSKEKELLDKYLATTKPELIDIVLIVQLIRKICMDSTEGAILVFLAGWDDINRAREALRASPFFKDPSKFLILSLHSMVPSSEQKKVFGRPPSRVRKIILSTNIAETAVTIDDVVYVVDSGRVKEKSYDPYSNVSTFHCSWISKASAKQREGRAGRCQPGTCYHLYSKLRAESFLDYQVPEIKRMPIEELCLQVKLLNPSCKISEFLQKTLDPPVLETVNNAIAVLQNIGALTQEEGLTDLGEKLGFLPIHPLTSKMLLFAIMMNCLEPALTLACSADYKEPFTFPVLPGEKKKAILAKAELASMFGGDSDQLVVVAAFECWKSAKDRGEERQFCSRYFVSSSTMNMLFLMRKQLRQELVNNGLIPDDSSSCSLNSNDPGILRAVLAAGCYPLVGKLLPKRKQDRASVIETPSGAKVRLHQHSLNCNISSKKSTGCQLVAYDEITRGDTGMFIRSCSLVGPYPLLLLAKELVVAPANDCDGDSADEIESPAGEEDGKAISSGRQAEQIMSSPDNTVIVVVDRWLKFESTALDVAQIYCLRERLAASILFKVRNPRSVLPPALGASMYAIACMLSYDGIPNPPLTDGPSDLQSSAPPELDGGEGFHPPSAVWKGQKHGFFNSSVRGKRPRGFSSQFRKRQNNPSPRNGFGARKFVQRTQFEPHWKNPLPEDAAAVAPRGVTLARPNVGALRKRSRNPGIANG